MSFGASKMGNWFAAAAFAEAGEHETAVMMAGGRVTTRRRAGILETVSRYFAAAAFAEENCTGPALEILGGGSRKNSFLETAGLQGVKVWYGTLSAEPASFLEEVGLGGVRVRYATVTL